MHQKVCFDNISYFHMLSAKICPSLYIRVRPRIKIDDKLAILHRLIAKDRVSCTQASGAKLCKRLNPLGRL